MELNDLRIYQLAMHIGEECWRLPETWPYHARSTLGRQLVRAADSVAANINEGYGRYHYAENRKFCFYARGSLSETRTWLAKAHNRGLIDDHDCDALIADVEDLAPMLNAYIRSIGPRDQ